MGRRDRARDIREIGSQSGAPRRDKPEKSPPSGAWTGHPAIARFDCWSTRDMDVSTAIRWRHFQRGKTGGRATDSLAIVLWRSTIAAVELSQSDHGPATSASSLVFVIGSTSFSLWARVSDGAF